MKKRPAAADAVTRKRPAMLGDIDGEEMDPDDVNISVAEKLKLATQLANGDATLAAHALNLKQSEKNRWKDKLDNPETCPELKKEWAALSELGHGRNKRLNLNSTSVLSFLFIYIYIYIYIYRIPKP